MSKPQEQVTQPEKSGGVQSINRAMSILQIVAETRQGITLAELSKRAGLHSSTAFHLAKTMVALGLLKQEPDSKRYRIGPQLFSLAAGATDEMELLKTASPILAQLAETTGEHSHVAVWAGSDVVIVGKCDGSASVRLAERVGVARPAYATALGKILLGGLSEEDLDFYLSTAEMRAITAKTVVDPVLLRDVVKESRDEGVAFDDGEFDPEVRCIAAPVYDFTGEVIAAVGISAPIWRLNLTRLTSATSAVKKSAGLLSEQMGHREGENYAS